MNSPFRRIANSIMYLTDAISNECFWFLRSIKYSMFYRGEEYLSNRLLVIGHGLEKGITMPNRRYGFGYGVVRLLISLCNEFITKYGYESQHLQIALNDLHEYLYIHESADYGLPSDISEGIRGLMSYKKRTETFCREISKDQFFYHTDFASFAYSRHTSRWYSDEDISKETIREVVALANTAPSACNRQSVRVKCICGRKVKDILELQNGNRGFGDKINKLLIVTFKQPSWEYNIQSGGYLDAGIYTMNLLYALHYYHLCACTLNAHLESSKIKRVQCLAELSPEEVPTVFIGIGRPAEKMMIAKSERLDCNTILSFVE